MIVCWVLPSIALLDWTTSIWQSRKKLLLDKSRESDAPFCAVSLRAAAQKSFFCTLHGVDTGTTLRSAAYSRPFDSNSFPSKVQAADCGASTAVKFQFNTHKKTPEKTPKTNTLQSASSDKSSCTGRDLSKLFL
jgi:hypothetical protein